MIELIETAGGEAVVFPLLEICEPTDSEQIEQRVGALPTYNLAIFISPTAVERGLKRVFARGDWPKKLRIAAVGQGTARKLHASGFQNITVPADKADSEALLALPEMSQVSDKRIIIFRGEGGRELLAETLRQRGAEVDYAECYRRAKPDLTTVPLLATSLPHLHAITVTSTESLTNLFELVTPENARLLMNIPMFVSHQRIADAARHGGISQVMLGEGGDAALAEAMVKFFQS